MNPTNALGWTLLHFLWQGALIAGLLAGALALLRHAGPRVRYAASGAAMLLMPVCALATFLELRFAGAPPDHSAVRLMTIAGFPAQVRGMDAGASAGIVLDIAGYLPALVWAWFAGVIALSIRSVGGWAVAERFARRRTSRAEAVWEERLAALATRLRISSPVRLAVSAVAEVPAVVGWLRPIVLVPASIFTGLSAEQIDALLAHELAHVRRYDYPINLLQTAAETLFFYHPAVWWVNRKIREERENCCDDLAVEVCGSTLAYVRALTDMERMRRSSPRLAMAADGGSLLNRVQRLLHVKQSAGSRPSGWIGGIGIAVAVLVTGIAANGLAQRPERAVATSAELENAVAQNADAVVRNADAVAQSADAAARNTDDVVRKADEVRQQVETVLRSVDDTLQNADGKGGGFGPGEGGGVGGGVQGLDAGTAQLNANARRMKAQIAELEAVLQNREFQRQRAELVQVEAALQQQVAEIQQRSAAQQQQTGWLAEIQAAGYRNLTVDQLIRLKEHGVTGEYIRQIRAAGQELSVAELLRFREHGVTPEFINEVKGTGFKDVKANDLIRLREHGVDAAWIRQIQSGGYPDVSLNDIIRLREHGVTPESVRDARNRFKDITLDQLMRMKESGVF